MGKSTLGNKLLNLNGTPEFKIRLFESEDTYSISPTHPTRKKRFAQADDPEHNACGGVFFFTPKCKLLANDNSNIRVLDVPGFSGCATLMTRVSVHEGIIQIHTSLG